MEVLEKVKFIIYIFIFNTYSYSQTIDNVFESLSIPNQLNVHNIVYKKTLSSKIKPDDKVVLVDQAFVVKYKNNFIEDSSKRAISIKLPDTCYSFKDGTRMIIFGLAINDDIIKQKYYRCVSFHFDNNLKIGDTAVFEILNLSLSNFQQFKPLIFFSEELKISKNGRFKNKGFFKLGRLDGSKNENDLKLSFIKLPITKKTIKFKWIHLIADYPKDDVGILIQRNLKVNQSKNSDDDLKQRQIIKYSIIDSSTDSMYFENIFFDYDSYLLKEYSKIDSIVKVLLFNKKSTVKIKGVADRRGSLDYNVLLAFNRSKSVYNYLINKGVDSKRITIEKPIIGTNSNYELNRSCNLEIHNYSVPNITH